MRHPFPVLAEAQQKQRRRVLAQRLVISFCVIAYAIVAWFF